MLEECTIGTAGGAGYAKKYKVSVVVRRMYYWDGLKQKIISLNCRVSVVVRRMYYWDLLIDDYETWKEGFQ